MRTVSAAVTIGLFLACGSVFALKAAGPASEPGMDEREVVQSPSTVDLRAFDGRASTLLTRLEEAGMRVYRLVDVADLRVPSLNPGTDPRAAVEAMARASGLEVEWVDGKPLLWRRAVKDELGVEAVMCGGWFADPRLIRALVSASVEGGDQGKRLAAECVLRFGRAAGVALIEREKTIALVRFALNSDDWLLRRQAVLAAADLALDEAPAVIEKATTDAHPQLRLAAAVAAGRLGGAKAIALLKKLAADQDTAVRQAAAAGAGQLGGAAGVGLLGELLDDQDAYVRVYAAWALGEVGTDEAVQALNQAATHADSRLRRAAATALGRCRGKGAVERLVALLPDVKENVKPGAAAAISLGWQGTPEAVKALVDTLDTAPRLEVIYGLGLANTPQARTALEPLLKHESDPVRRAAAFALGQEERVDGSPFELAIGEKVMVLPERPRVFLRPDGWEGPTLAKMRAHFHRPDYQDPVRKDKLPNSRLGQVVLWLASGDELAGREAARWAGETVTGGFNRTTGSTPSYSGISLERNAALYDWTHGHGDVPAVVRRLIMHHLEEGADYFLNGWLKNNASTVFYSRRWGALAGCGVAGAALFGDSPRGREQLAWVADQLTREDGLGSIRQAQDGASAGSSYGLHHMMTDTANLVAAIQSATDFDLAGFTQAHRGDWLQKQLYFQMWMTYPDGQFVKDGDIWGARDADQYRMQVDVITSLYKNGFGRTWADLMHRRWPKAWPSDYHTEFVWQFFVFNDPAVKPRPLAEMPRTAFFSPKIDGYVMWRSSWDDDATIVHFHAGDSVDMHGAHDQGKFMVFKRTPLAVKNGSYPRYGSPVHSYYRSPWSGNCLVFDDGKNQGRQSSYTARAGGVNSYAEFVQARAALGPVVGKVILHEANEQFARAVALLDGATPDKGARSKWTRELVFLDHTYLLVLDRVTVAPGTTVRSVLNFRAAPVVEGARVRADNPPGRLFVQALLPEKPTITVVGGETADAVMKAGNDWRMELTGPDPSAAEQVFLSVLYAADVETAEAPAAALTRDGAKLTVAIAGRSYTFE